MIVFNGVRYGSVAEMSEDVRRQYERLMRRGQPGSEPDEVPEALDDPAPAHPQTSKITSPGGDIGDLDGMPPRVQKLFESLNRDSDGNGVPDVFEPGGEGVAIPDDVKTASRKICVRREIVDGKEVISEIVVNGRKYTSEDKMPPGVKKIYADFLARLDTDGDGTPDVLQVDREGAIAITGPRRVKRVVSSGAPIVVESESSRSSRVRRLEKTVAFLVILFLILVAYVLVVK